MDGSQTNGSWSFGNGCTITIRDFVAHQKRQSTPQQVQVKSSESTGPLKPAIPATTSEIIPGLLF